MLLFNVKDSLRKCKQYIYILVEFAIYVSVVAPVHLSCNISYYQVLYFSAYLPAHTASPPPSQGSRGCDETHPGGKGEGKLAARMERDPSLASADGARPILGQHHVFPPPPEILHRVITDALAVVSDSYPMFYGDLSGRSQFWNTTYLCVPFIKKERWFRCEQHALRHSILIK